MKKGKVVVTILLVIIVGILMFIVGQYVANKTDYNLFKESDKTTKNNVTNDENAPEVSKEHNFIKSVSSDVFFSGKSHKLMVYYYKENFEIKESDENYEGAKANNLLDGAEIYTEIYLDNKKVVDMKRAGFSKNQKLEEIDNINSSILEEYRILSDANSNKEYLLIHYFDMNDDGLSSFIFGVAGGTAESILINENGNVLDSYRFHDAGYGIYIKVNNNQLSKFSDRSFEYGGYNSGLTLNYNYGYLDVKNNYMYYLDVPSGCGSESFDEYRITINNGKINKEKVNTYTSDQLEQVGGNCRQK